MSLELSKLDLLKKTQEQALLTKVAKGFGHSLKKNHIFLAHIGGANGVNENRHTMNRMKMISMFMFVSNIVIYKLSI